MSNNITVVVELSQADRDRLDNIISLLQQTPTRPLSEPQNEDEAVTPEMTQGEPDAPAPALPVEPAVESATGVTGPDGAPGIIYTKEQVLAKVQSMAGPNNPKREQVKAIVRMYGVKVSDIPEDKYTEVMEKLIELEG